MLSELSAIYYATDLVIPPIFPDFKISKAAIVELFNNLQKPGEYGYDNVETQGEKPMLFTRRGSGRSSCQLHSDRIRIEEDKPGTEMTIDEFVGVVKTIHSHLKKEILPPFVIQRCLMRFTLQPHGSNDAIELLAGKVSRAHDKIGPFKRPPSQFGIRFRFPPVELHYGSPEDEDAEDDEESESAKIQNVAEKSGTEEVVSHDGYLTIRIESYVQDAGKIWVEISAMYPDPIQGDGLADIEKNLKHTYNFVAENVVEFLNQFDVPTSTDGPHGEKP